jgi:hypothetical protein
MRLARKRWSIPPTWLNGGGPPATRSDADWIAQARQHIQALDASGVRFDRVLLEIWDKYPAHTFSVSDPADTLAGLVTVYVRAHPRGGG